MSSGDAHAPLWGLGIYLFVVGDLATTAAGLRLGLSETHPVGQQLLATAAGPTALLVPKLLAVALCAALYVAVSRRSETWAVGVPVGLALTGAALTAWNGLLIVSVAAPS